jgi:hypothetical protein
MAPRVALTLGVAAACALAGTHAHAAAACDAPWMHEGGGFTTTLTPYQRTVTYTVTQFSKRDGNNCNGAVRVDMKMSMGGQPMQSESNVSFEIADGKVAPPSQKNAGSLRSTGGGATFNAALSSQTTGLLSYVGEITGEGQHLAGTSTQGSVSGTVANMGQSAGTMNVPKFVTTTSDKSVGKQEQLQTAAGKFDCWPVTYDRSMHADHAQMMGHTANLSMKSHVVDHFCPAAGLVMRQDTTVNGKTLSMTVSALH